MGTKITRGVFRTLVAALSVAAAAAAPAQAGLLVQSAPSCAAQAVSQPFAQWGDRASYTLAPGGAFESGGPTWKLSGASVVSGNESFYVRSRSDTRSLKLPPGASATSPTMCVGLEHPTLRLFARNDRLLVSTLTVEVLFETSLGLQASAPVGVVLPSGKWKPTPRFLVLANLLPLLPGDHTPVAFRVRSVGTGTWWIDDFYVDPKRH
jgi:hypothetical protein